MFRSQKAGEKHEKRLAGVALGFDDCIDGCGVGAQLHAEAGAATGRCGPAVID
jgi:hypothetical protein